MSKLLLNGFPPESLCGFLLDCIQRTRLGLHGMAAAADVVAADCRFNHWIASGKKHAGPIEYPGRTPPLDLEENSWLELLDALHRQDKKCREAIVAYSAGGSEEILCAELSEVAAFLNRRDFH